MTWWPFVSRARFEDAQKQIADLKVANAQLLELALSRPAAYAQADETETLPEPSKPHRKLGAQLRAEFRAAAEMRASEAKLHKGVN
ncbi:MAG: hypothetical protein ABSE51_19900 [Terracidiphilus sp.]